MINTQLVRLGLPTILLALLSLPAAAQSFRVQCPTSTVTHPTAANNNAEPAYTVPTTLAPGANGYLTPTAHVNGAIKCQQIAGGDGYATMGDGTQTYMFSFGPLSGLANIANGQPGTVSPDVFNTPYPATATPLNVLQPGDPATTDGVTANTWGTWSATSPLLSTSAFIYNGAVGQVLDIPNLVTIYDINQVTVAGPPAVTTVTV